MPDDIILTTPPVHDDGPDTGVKEIEGGETAKTGLDSKLRAEFERIGEELAVRNTRVAIAVPVKQLIAAAFRVFENVPRIPDYDSTTAHLATWAEETEYSPIEVPDADPDALGVFVREQGPDAGKVCIELTRPATGKTHTLDFEADSIESFFLAGLAACAYARTRR